MVTSALVSIKQSPSQHSLQASSKTWRTRNSTIVAVNFYRSPMHVGTESWPLAISVAISKKVKINVNNIRIVQWMYRLTRQPEGLSN